tara:strand:+ start:42 stop:209 length:168 start_codon:yes stop_codon:yes gene_type:complete
MIRPEKYQWNWKPRYNNIEDQYLAEQLEKIRERLGVKKSELLRNVISKIVSRGKI